MEAVVAQLFIYVYTYIYIYIILYYMVFSLRRSILLCALTCCLGGTFLLEQPGSSLLRYYNRLVWLRLQVPAIWTHWSEQGLLSVGPFKHPKMHGSGLSSGMVDGALQCPLPEEAPRLYEQCLGRAVQQGETSKEQVSFRSHLSTHTEICG